MNASNSEERPEMQQSADKKFQERKPIEISCEDSKTKFH